MLVFCYQMKQRKGRMEVEDRNRDDVWLVSVRGMVNHVIELQEVAGALARQALAFDPPCYEPSQSQRAVQRESRLRIFLLVSLGLQGLC